MTAIADILERSFFEAGLTTELQHATPTQTNNAMQTLATLIDFLYGTNAGEYLQPWPLGNFGRTTQSRMSLSEQMLRWPQQNARLVAVNEEAITVYLPTDPSDGARIGIMDPLNHLAAAPVTIDANGRSIENVGNVVLNTNGTNRIWFYRGDLGNWVRIVPLVITDEMPFPSDYDQMFIIMMAMRLNPAYGRNVSSVQAQFLKEFRQQFVARYVQSAPLAINPEVSLTSRQSFNTYQDYWYGGGNTDAFNRGMDGWWWGP